MPSDGHHASDPLEGEKRRLNYESLFARVVIPAGSGHVTSPQASLDQPPPAGVAGVDGAALGVPTVDAIADAVLRATQRQQPHPAAPVDPASQQTGQNDERLGRPSTAGRDGEYVLFEGTLISATLLNRLDGSTAGPVKCLVNSPVYARKDRQLLIPPGAVVLGTSTPVQLMGESRIAVSFHRLRMPDDRSYSLDHFTGLNQLGDAGLRDRVNQHYLSTFGAAAAIGLLTGLSHAIGTAGFTGGDGDRTIVIAGTTGETTQATTRVLDRMLNRPPTVTIREGHRVVVYVTSDLHLPAYAWPGTP
jgi:type IV secretion system protein VirB10